MTDINTDIETADEKKAPRKTATPWYVDGGMQTAVDINPADHEPAQVTYARAFNGLEADAFAVGAPTHYGTWSKSHKKTFLGSLFVLPLVAVALLFAVAAVGNYEVDQSIVKSSYVTSVHELGATK